MPDSKDAEMYQAIGHAVGMSQLFEFVFTVCVKLVFKQKDVTSADDLAPLDNNSFKVATTALLKELKQIMNVHEDFEKGIVDFAEQRHTLIHRWFRQKGWPQHEKDKVELTALAQSVSRGALDLSTILGSYVIAWMKKFPETRAGAEFREGDWAALVETAKLSLRIEA